MTERELELEREVARLRGQNEVLREELQRERAAKPVPVPVYPSNPWWLWPGYVVDPLPQPSVQPVIDWRLVSSGSETLTVEGRIEDVTSSVLFVSIGDPQ